ncbi:speedy protein A [Xyrichtys novacula]|uniref:Speedy protein A n=1 Tax=Xyrichtys novacula TaxID=13765 RepID=A0AAV1GKJ0_XYRNO|nr:speedy protein A [Xyrichtys novacula]
MKRSHKSEISVTVWVKPNTIPSLQARRCLELKNENEHTLTQIIVVHDQEMSAFFRIFDDKLIHKFLLMDSCYKLTDKYLLAMTFVYFKRAGFIIAEYTVENFFIALHLANTMEEDEVENTYEIFPWALGKSWGILFKQFIKQRDKLWVRIKFRARVHRNVCEEVMAIEPSHPLWQRNRPEHHGFAQRQYGDQPYSLRGPWASPVFCAPCHSLTMIRRDEDSRRKTVKTECEAQISDSCAEEVPSKYH